MAGKLPNNTLFVVAGLVYGLALASIAVVAAGAGHGTYVLLGLCSSPLGLMQNVAVALLGTPVMWCLVAALLSAAKKPGCKAAFLAAMVAHYAALPIVLSGWSNFGDWEYAEKVPASVTFGAAVYAAGQVALWAAFALGSRVSSAPPE